MSFESLLAPGALLQDADYQAALTAFLQAYPEYETTGHIDELRAAEYPQLDERGHVYLDYTGGSLYAGSQLQDHLNLLREHIYGNPHSSNPTSLATTRLVEKARNAVHDYFNASPDEYLVIFTPNASGALKLVGEAYPFFERGQFLLTFDNHNSVNGIREYVRSRGAITRYVPVSLPDLRVDETRLKEFLGQADTTMPNLFAYPAQSNFSGVQHPLDWIDLAHNRGWDVLLDAAAFVPTNRLDLGEWKPDFVPVSFYKMFGYPTGVGCLLARRAALEKLERPWFAGGTISVASVQGDTYYPAKGPAAFEDGTLNYLALPAVTIGLQHLRTVGPEPIHHRVRTLTGWLLDALHHLRHETGTRLIRIYGPVKNERRGGTVTMNFYDPAGRFFDHRYIEAEANRRNISLRTGCFCNPGGGEIALELSRPELVACFRDSDDRITMDDFRLCIDGKNSGAVRVSAGLVSNFADVYRFYRFARGFLNQPATE